MANLAESAAWESGIYQIETTDDVLGGADGISNLQAKQLANRTLYLKGALDSALELLDAKQSVRVATTANIVLSGVQTIDGVLLFAGDRVLVKNQTLPVDNGIYVVAVGAWARAADANVSAEVTPGMATFVEEGATLGNTRWQLVTDAPITLGATVLTFQDITQGYAPLASPALTGTPTAPNVAAGTRGTQLATMQSFASEFVASKVENGYQKMPSGLIIQWGSVNTGATPSGTITFPISFPMACAVVVPVDYGQSYSDVNNVRLNIPTTTGVQWYTQNFSGAVGTGASTWAWFAIGY